MPQGAPDMPPPTPPGSSLQGLLSPLPATMGALLRQRAAATPHAPFWVVAATDPKAPPLEEITYAQLAQQAQDWAFRLGSWAAELPQNTPKVVAVCAANSWSYAALHFAAAMAGVVLAHIHHRSVPQEVARRCQQVKAGWLVVDEAQEANWQAAFGEGEAAGVLGAAPQRVVLGQKGGMLPFSVAGGAVGVGEGTSQPKEALANIVLPPESPEAVFQLLFTSGSTGEPKAAKITHQAKMAQGLAHAHNMRLQAGHRVLSALPFGHQFAQWLVLVAVPMVGATVQAEPQFTPERWWGLLAAGGITHLPAVPTMLYRLLAHPAVQPVQSLQNVTYGGAPIRPEALPDLAAVFPQARLFQGFGQTEAGYCMGLHHQEHRTHPTSVGRPPAGTQVRLVDPQHQPVLPGQVGELVVATPSLMEGYWEAEADTQAYFAYQEGDSLRWGKTGDLAWQDAEGYYYLAGRRRELVISGGENIHPLEVERVLESHPQVALAVVWGVPHPDLGEQLVAVLQPEIEAKPEPDWAAVEAHCRQQLPGFKVPRQARWLKELPLTPSGKVAKALLREQVQWDPLP